MGQRKSHDQNFKNLILDYPHESLAFFAAEEAENLTPSVKITPIRQEQLKGRLGDRFHELDVPLLVEWPCGKREALLFTLEEETDPNRFSIHRLAHYTLHLSELFETERVVPVVFFLHSNQNIAESLHIKSERHSYLQFNYLHTQLSSLSAEQFFNSQNIVARLNLPNMHWADKDKIDVYANAIQGLFALEPDLEKQLKYIDFVDIYSELDEDERQAYQRRYPQEESKMAGLAERLRNEGMQQGMQQGLHEGIEGALRLQLKLKFGELPGWAEAKLRQASDEQLTHWLTRILNADSLTGVLS
ncbi:hypothetical protein [Halomonas sp. ISL-56]|uniref:hypothetical protein n=1 Tax=Halomonas sp. ISL-56 TaxID=2819149 RepID=UPI0020365AF8|nr:hypothetical protein [Halomonas sp. ISL-56]